MGHYGGSYKVSNGLYKKYGEMRLLDTPICENGFLGMGAHAAGACSLCWPSCLCCQLARGQPFGTAVFNCGSS